MIDDLPSARVSKAIALVQSTLGPSECKAALDSALRQPRIAQVLAKLREAHMLRIIPTVCDPTEHLR